MNQHLSLVAVATAALLLAGGCSGSTQAEKPASDVTRTPAEASSSAAGTGAVGQVDLPVADGSEVDGLVTVDGHDLAVRCTGLGDPTVVILHGWIDEPGIRSHDLYGPLTAELERDFRVCDYDRANVGDSEVVPGTQTPQMVAADLDGLMDALGDPGPYVLLGQSAGGMVASVYAVAHPDKVAAMVMVDASFDEEVTLEGAGMLPKGVGPCDPANRRFDGEVSLQRIDNCAMYEWAYERRDRRPTVPLVYLAARQAPWSGYTDFGPEYTEKIVPLQKAYAASWSPGRFIWVDSGHEIHREKPDVVADAVRWVVRKGRE